MLNRENKITLSDAGETSAADELQETMEYFGLSNEEVVKRLGITEAQLKLILEKKIFMSAELAQKIEKRVGGSAKIMVRLDANYRLHHLPVEKRAEQRIYLQSLSY